MRAFIGACALAASSAAYAQAWPASPVRWIVPVTAGGPVDLVTRIVAQPLSASLGQPVVVEVRASASSIVGVLAVAQSAPDGYTILSHSNLVPHRFMYKSPPFDYQRDFAPITLLARSPVLLFVHESVPARTLAELVAHLKSQPGKLAYGSSGFGQPFHLAMEDFKRRTGTDILHVPYKGGAQVIPDLVSGRVQMTLFNLAEQLLAQVRAGKLRAVFTTSAKRMADLPDVPTLEEVGMRDFDPFSYTAVSAPAATPRDIVERLNREIVRAIALPEVVRGYAKLNLYPATTTTGEMARMIANDIESRGPMLKGLGITLD
jgi:tripartite-type tricarboxylate transporter receptor subunit TctC